MPADRRVIFSDRVVLDDRVSPAAVAIAIANGRIAEIIEGDRARSLADDRLDGLVLMPGIVDSHVHVNEPGRTDWEGFATAGRAAAAGGVTSIIVMPLNCTPAATNVPALRLEAAAAAASCMVDFGFWGGVVPGNHTDISLMRHAGALGFKCFLTPSGVDDFANVSEVDLDRAMPILTALNAPLLVHAELPAAIDAARAASGLDRSPRSYAAYLASRPPRAEHDAIELMIRLCARHGTRIHIVHLADADALPMLREARNAGLPISVETCPHYLCLSAEEIPDGATLFKCAPPIRESRHRESLWSALAHSEIDLIASDHSPCPPALKLLDQGDFSRAWGGIASLQLSLPVIWTEAHRRGRSPAHLARWLCAGPAHLAGLSHRKGRIALGLDADLVAWEPDATFTVRASELEHRHKATPYDGRELRGVVRRTFLSGREVFNADRAGTRLHTETRGQWLTPTVPAPNSPA